MPHPDTFFIKPAEGLRIADPKTGDYLPEGGMLMLRSGFWIRRLKDGDVIEVKQGVSAPVTSQSGQPVNPEPVSEPVKSGKAGADVPAKKE